MKTNISMWIMAIISASTAKGIEAQKRYERDGLIKVRDYLQTQNNT